MEHRKESGGLTNSVVRILTGVENFALAATIIKGIRLVFVGREHDAREKEMERQGRTTGLAKEATARDRRRTMEVSLRPNMVGIEG